MLQDLTVAMVLIQDHNHALSQKRKAIQAVQGRRVTTPRDKWEAHKWIRLEVSIRSAVYGQAEKLISNEQLYADLAI